MSALAQIISLAAASRDSEKSALIYFAIAVGFTLICLVAFFVMMSLVRGNWVSMQVQSGMWAESSTRGLG